MYACKLNITKYTSRYTVLQPSVFYDIFVDFPNKSILAF